MANMTVELRGFFHCFWISHTSCHSWQQWQFVKVEKVQWVAWFIKTKSDTQVQRNFRMRYRREPPTHPSICKWHEHFMGTGSVIVDHHVGRPRTSDENNEQIWEHFQRSPCKLIWKAAKQLWMLPRIIHTVLRKCLRLYLYQMQLLQALQPNDRPKRLAFAETVLSCLEDDENFLNMVAFSDESTFHVWSQKRNVHIWGSHNPLVVMEVQRDRPKVNVWCRLLVDKVIGPYFFAEDTEIHELSRYAWAVLDITTRWLAAKCALLLWAWTVHHTLNETFPSCWIRRGGPIPWPLTSPDITPLNFFLWGYVKGIVYETGSWCGWIEDMYYWCGSNCW